MRGCKTIQRAIYVLNYIMIIYSEQADFSKIHNLCEGVKDWPRTAENKAVSVYAIELSQFLTSSWDDHLVTKAVAGTGLSAYFTTSIRFFA
jgi:hypothetical protein